MFEKLITDLKKSLPEPLRKKLGIAEDSMAYSEENSPVSATNTSSEEDKKKRNSMILRVVIILGIAYFALDEFVLKGDQNQNVSEAAPQAHVKKKKVKPVVEEAPAALPTVAEVPTETPAETSAADHETPTAPIENINVLDKSETIAESAPVPQVTQAPEVTETKIGETTTNIDQKIDQLIDNVDQSSTTEEVKIPSQNASHEEKVEPKADSSMASKIVDEATETPPPAYDQVGRGLVYNCKDKYWACLDKPAYVTCNKNMKWNKSKGSAAECVVQDIYNSEEDCAKIQKYNVSTNVATGFCSN